MFWYCPYCLSQEHLKQEGARRHCDPLLLVTHCRHQVIADPEQIVSIYYLPGMGGARFFPAGRGGARVKIFGVWREVNVLEVFVVVVAAQRSLLLACWLKLVQCVRLLEVSKIILVVPRSTKCAKPKSPQNATNYQTNLQSAGGDCRPL